jgi:hypothetical protein
MSDLPPPDLMDQSGRARRIILALIIGAAVGTAAYYISYGLSKPDEYHHEIVVATQGPWRFVWYMTAFFGMGAFALTLLITNHLAKKKWRAELVARAKVVG